MLQQNALLEERMAGHIAAAEASTSKVESLQAALKQDMRDVATEVDRIRKVFQEMMAEVLVAMKADD